MYSDFVLLSLLLCREIVHLDRRGGAPYGMCALKKYPYIYYIFVFIQYYTVLDSRADVVGARPSSRVCRHSYEGAVRSRETSVRNKRTERIGFAKYRGGKKKRESS